MNNSRLQYLFEKYFNKTASTEERDELARLVGMENHREQVMRLFTAAWEKYEGEGIVISAKRADEMLQDIFHSPAPSVPVEVSASPAETGIYTRREEEKAPKVRSMHVWVRIAAAAVILLVITEGYRLLISRQSTNAKTTIAQKPSGDVRPGSYKACLTLADGRRIVLDSAALGKLAQQGSTAVINKNGRLVYQAGPGSRESVVYNTLATSKGETYSFTLADGSKVWLNSGSSVHFPVSFPGKERRIEITGEAYVKVAKDPAKSFIVSVNGMEVQALGTEFNINAYSDEDNINTTLIDGAVKVTKGEEHALLKPGEQTKLNVKGHLSQPVDVNVAEVVSWKEGNFQFESADIKTILRQFARWYDVEIIYESPVKDRRFFCIVSRNSTLANVLQMLKASDIKFRIEGKKLYVTSG